MNSIDAAINKHLIKQDKADADWQHCIDSIDQDHSEDLKEIIRSVKAEADEYGFEFIDLWAQWTGDYL